MNVINYQALQQPVTEQMIAQYRHMYNVQAPRAGAQKLTFWVFVAITASIGIIGVTFIALTNDWPAGLMIILFGLILWAIFTGIQRSMIKTEQLRARYYQFAKDNNLHYWPETKSPNHNGMMFLRGDTRTAYHQFFTTSGRIFEFGNYSYMTGSGKSRSRHDLGYVSIYLDRNLPHMVLDSRKNNVSVFGANMSNLPVSFSKDQQLSLEGDFNEHFVLYAPKEYERDALYVFAPDLMALMIDNVAQFDAEIIDNKLYVYSTTPFDFNNIQLMDRLFSIVTLVGAKAARQTEKYKDTRIMQTEGAAHVVAPAGRRLKQRVSWLAIVFVVIFLLLNSLGTIVSFIETFR